VGEVPQIATPSIRAAVRMYSGGLSAEEREASKDSRDGVPAERAMFDGKRIAQGYPGVWPARENMMKYDREYSPTSGTCRVPRSETRSSRSCRRASRTRPPWSKPSGRRGGAVRVGHGVAISGPGHGEIRSRCKLDGIPEGA